MDTSKQYIEMCHRAQEIQNDKEEINYQEGDFYANIKFDKSYKINIASQMDEYIEGFNWWLPRQDQLQEMVKKEGNIWDFNRWFYKKTEGEITKYYLQFTSMEQLWLALVMKEKHNKIWNNGNWENIQP